MKCHLKKIRCRGESNEHNELTFGLNWTGTADFVVTLSDILIKGWDSEYGWDKFFGSKCDRLIFNIGRCNSISWTRISKLELKKSWDEKVCSEQQDQV
jgi:hypothetical protein